MKLFIKMMLRLLFFALYICFLVKIKCVTSIKCYLYLCLSCLIHGTTTMLLK